MTNIFPDGGDPDKSEELMHLLGFLDGQTTNTALISKNPDATKLRMVQGDGFEEVEAIDSYRQMAPLYEHRSES